MNRVFHLILRSRPDVVATWDDTEVARRWLILCPVRKSADGGPTEPSEPELNSIRFDEDKLKTIRSRLSDISWWMRLLCQRIAQKANFEEEISGKFWQSRYRAVRLIDDEAILACAAYVDLNPIRAGIAQTIEDSQFTSARLRLQTIVDSTESTRRELPVQSGPVQSGVEQSSAPESTQASTEFETAIDSFLAPVEIDELNDPLGARASASKYRCSDKGFLAMPTICLVVVLERRSMSTEESFRSAYGPIKQVYSLSRCDLTREALRARPISILAGLSLAKRSIAKSRHGNYDHAKAPAQ